MATMFYKCPLCSNIIVKNVVGDPMLVCCGEPKKELSLKGADGTPKVEGRRVTRPMPLEHHICTIFTGNYSSGQSIALDPVQSAIAENCTCKAPVVTVYEYCNLHKL